MNQESGIRNQESRILKLVAAFLMLSTPLTTVALEIDFPAVGADGVKPQDIFGPGNWINYIFVFSLAVVGLAVIGQIVYAGIVYMTAGDNQSKVSEARDRIKGALLGLVILLGSYIFLNTINPQLVNIQNPKLNIEVESLWGSYWEELFGSPAATPSEKQVLDRNCQSDRECISDYCNRTPPLTPSNPGKCASKKANGAVCAENRECVSGTCNPTEKKCAESSL